jgi:hypothetical protein
MVEIIGEGGPADRDSTNLYTRKGNRIPSVRRGQRAPSAMRAAFDFITKDHPTRRVRSLDSSYNCMGMIFASRRSCIEPAQFQAIAADDGYECLPPNKMALPGDVVVYRDENGEVVHVGRIVDYFNIDGLALGYRVLSQIGADGEYIHNLDDLPQFPIKIKLPPELWTERYRNGRDILP